MMDTKRTGSFSVYSLQGRPFMSIHFTCGVAFFHDQFIYLRITHRFPDKQTLDGLTGAF